MNVVCILQYAHPQQVGEAEEGRENTSHLLTPLVMRHNIHTWFSWANWFAKERRLEGRGFATPTPPPFCSFQNQGKHYSSSSFSYT